MSQRNPFKILPLLMLASCAAVDQFGERIYDGNKNSQLAQNQETLVNIVRASRYQPLNFVAISQITGAQSEMLSTGLPTITIGPLQTAAQHQFQVTNSVQSGVTGGYQGAPLVSTAFSTGMLSPIDLKTFAFLVSAYPREPVFFSVIEAIIIKPKSSGVAVRLVNDPSRDKDEDCKGMIGNFRDSALKHAVRCNFSVFVNYLGVLTNVGLSAELIKSAGSKQASAQNAAKKSASPATPSGSPGSSSGDSSSSQGRICFDQTRGFSAPFRPLCGDNSKTTNAVFRFADLGEADVSIILRSPVGVFNFYGSLLAGQPPQWAPFYFTFQARNLVGDEPFLNIVQDAGGPCFSSVRAGGENFCVPESSRHTALLMTLLLHLKNLNIQPSDLNSAFSVHLSGT